MDGTNFRWLIGSVLIVLVQDKDKDGVEAVEMVDEIPPFSRQSTKLRAVSREGILHRRNMDVDGYTLAHV